ncbi:MAG: ATP cone domain-containing protein [Patescibacteria group bacterium]
MATQVLKRDSSLQPFDPEKIKRSVQAAGREAGIEEAALAELADKVSVSAINTLAEKEQVSYSEIRQAVFAELENFDPRVIQAWKNHEQKVKGLTV